MKNLSTIALACVIALGLTACGDKHDSGGDNHAEHDVHDHAAQNGGVLVETSDHSVHFEVKHDIEAGLIQVWIYDGEMAAVKSTAPIIQLAKDSGGAKITGVDPKGATKAHEWHFGDRALSKHVHGRLRLQHDGKSYNVDLPEDDHGHDHDDHDGHDEHGPHAGMVAAFAGMDGKEAGHVELKLHDDKGDLELWLATDEAIKAPFDLTLASTITVTFHGRDKAVTLRVRNTDKNEDEDGTANNRAGKTNYFIFPGDTGADASLLMGGEFSCPVSVSFASGSSKYSTKQFTLIPHSHGDDHGHEHK